MDRKNFYKKLEEISLDPPTEFPKTQCLNRPITYRETCIDYVKKTMRCVGYRDYVVAELEKLGEIEQIIEQHDNDNMPENYWYIFKIKEVLKQE